MFCTNCGAKMEDGQRFCGNCGARVELSTPAAPKAPAPPPAPPYTPAEAPRASYPPQGQIRPDRPKKKKGGLVLAVLGVVLAAALALVLIFWGSVSAFAANLYHKSFSQPEEYYQYVENRALNRAFSAAEEASVTRSVGENGFYEEKLMLSYDQGALSGDMAELVEDSLGFDLSWLKNAGVYLSFGAEDGLVGGGAVPFLNDTDIASVDYVLDPEDAMLYVSIPLLSERALALDAGDLPLDSLGAFSGAAGALPALLADRDRLNAMALRYSELVLGNLSHVEKGKAELTAGQLSRGCTAFEVDVDGRTAQRIARQVLQEAIDDEELAQLIRELATAGGAGESEAEQAYRQLRDEMRSRLEQLNNTDPSEITQSIRMSVYVDELGDILGREIRVMDGGEELGRFCYALIAKGGSFGARLELQSDEDGERFFSLDGGGRLNGRSLSGSFALFARAAEDGEELFAFQALQLDLEGEWKDKTLSYTLALTPTKELLDRALEEAAGMPAEAEELLRSLSLVLSGEAKSQRAVTGAALKTGGRDLLRLDAELYTLKPFALSLPGNAAETNEWLSGVDSFQALTALADKLREAGVPASLLQSILYGY